MRVLLAGLMLIGATSLLWDAPAQEKKPEQKKEITLKGKIACGKCELMVDAECATVIVVKQDKKDIVYYFDPAGHKKHHDEICSVAKNGSVTGVVSDSGKKKIITVKTIKFD